MERWELEFLKAMRGLTILYNKPCNEDLLEIYRMVLKPLTVEELIQAVKSWIEDPNNKFFPLPAQLKALAGPQAGTEGEASLIADRIWASLCSYGTDWVGEGRARDKIGEVGWELIQNSGGWDSFSRSVTDVEQAPILKAQWRKSIFEIMKQTYRASKTPLGQKELDLKNLGVEMRQLK